MFRFVCFVTATSSMILQLRFIFECLPKMSIDFLTLQSFLMNFNELFCANNELNYQVHLHK